MGGPFKGVPNRRGQRVKLHFFPQTPGHDTLKMGSAHLGPLVTETHPKGGGMELGFSSWC